ncbi:hypothetical protein D9M70_446740 [compost metagenome]
MSWGGTPWQWGDLDAWSNADWQALVEQDCHRTWGACHCGAIAGYYELYRPDGCNTEIRYFGLASQFLGYGFGGADTGWHPLQQVFPMRICMPNFVAARAYLA